MFKYKSGKEGNMLILTGQNGQQINERELYAINSGQVNGFLPVEALRQPNGFQLSYHVTGLVPLRDFLRITPLNKKLFVMLLQDILQTMKNAQDAHFSTKLIQYDVTLIMVDPATFRLYFLYVPVQPFGENGTLRDALLGIIRNASVVGETDVSYVQRFVTIVNEGVHFSFFDLEEYMQSLLKELPQAQPAAAVCPNCNAPVGKEDAFCTNCGAKLKKEAKKQKGGVYTPVAGERFEPAPKPEESKSDAYSVGENENGVVTVFKANGEKNSQAYLIRTKTNERILLSQFPFRIGKMQGCTDYRVTDNKTVSRHHADILKAGEQYYIQDKNSTNGTYVDGCRLDAQAQQELQSGAVILLSNEAFTFEIQ